MGTAPWPALSTKERTLPIPHGSFWNTLPTWSSHQQEDQEMLPDSSQTGKFSIHMCAHGASLARWAYLSWPASNSCNYMLLTQRPLAVSIGCVGFHFLLCCFALSKSCHAQPWRHLHFADGAMERRSPSQGSLIHLLPQSQFGARRCYYGVKIGNDKPGQRWLFEEENQHFT